MAIKDIASLANGYPTIMDLDQEIFLIQELEKLDPEDIARNRAEFLEVVSKIWDTHSDSGVFRVNKSNEGVFLGFARWLRSIEQRCGIPLSHIADDIGLDAAAIAKSMAGKN